MVTAASTSALQGLERGIVTAANVVDHVTPHKRDWNAFVTGELQPIPIIHLTGVCTENSNPPSPGG
jgi:hypothetical protein